MPTPYLDDAAISGFLSDPAVASARTAANSMGAIDSVGHFAGTPKSTGPDGLFDRIKRIFGGAAPKTKIATDEMAQAFGQISLQESLKGKAQSAGLPTANYDSEINRLKGVIQGHAEEVFPQMHAAKLEHLTAQQVLGEAQMKAVSAAEKAHLAEWNSHTAAGTLTATVQADLQANRQATLDAIKTKFQPEIASHSDVIDNISKLEAQVQHHTGLNASEVIAKSKSAVPAVAETAAKSSAAVAGLAKNAVGEVISKEATALGVIGEEAYKGKNMFGRMAANAKANLSIGGDIAKEGGQITAKASSVFNKGIKIASTGAGAVLVGYGLKDLGQVVGFVSPDVDEQGKEVPADSGKLIKSIAEVGAGAALAYLSLLKGGKAAGMVKA